MRAELGRREGDSGAGGDSAADDSGGGAALPAGLHRSFKAGFEVHLQKHWRANVGLIAVHARFLKTLARRLIGRKDVFRVLLAPGYPGHTGHFPFDMASFRMVQIFDDGELLTAEPPRS